MPMMGEQMRELSAVIRSEVARVEVGIWDLLQWAFQREAARVAFDDLTSPDAPAPGFGLEYVLLQRAMLGCKVDGGGVSPAHPDADLVAAALAQLPPERGGRRMALAIAEMARAGQMPDWMPEARPRIEPVEWRNSKHGLRAKVSDGGVETWVSRGRVRQQVRRLCEVRYSPSVSEIAAARRRYLEWWAALAWVRDTLSIDARLGRFDLTMAMPPMQPWKNP